MKIKIVILDKDSNYLNRMVSAFKTRYSERLMIFSCTNLDEAMEELRKNEINVFIADSSFKTDMEKIPSSCGFACLTSSQNEKVDGDVKCIFKFQRADKIFDEILGINEETVRLERERIERMEREKLEKERLEKERLEQERRKNANKIITFLPTGGGVGTSTLAAACAIHFAKSGKKTLYINTESLYSTDVFFKGENGHSLIEVIDELKKNKESFAEKLGSYAVKDTSGVQFYGRPNNPFDMLSVTSQDIFELIENLKSTYIYDYIILDCGLTFYPQSNRFVIVGNGTEISNKKAVVVVKMLEQLDRDSKIKEKVSMFYNRFNQSSGEKTDLVKCIGTSCELEVKSAKDAADKLSNLDVFDFH